MTGMAIAEDINIMPMTLPKYEQTDNPREWRLNGRPSIINRARAVALFSQVHERSAMGPTRMRVGKRLQAADIVVTNVSRRNLTFKEARGMPFSDAKINEPFKENCFLLSLLREF
jgi:hypothetical protein